MRQGRYGEDGDCIHRSEIEDAIAYATSRGWSVESGDGRVRIYCANTERDGCQIGINATPLDTATHAKQIRRAVDRCPHSVEGVD